MPPLAKFHPATLIDLNKWSTLSRNEIGPFLTRLGIKPLNSKYPMLRVYEGVLGLSPSDEVDEETLGRGLIRTSKVAAMIGLTPDDLLKKLRTKNCDYPPLYCFGPKRHLMLRGQVEQMLRSPRNEWQPIEPLQDHALPASRLARSLNVRQSRIDALLENEADLPARIFLQGRVRYILADVAHRLNVAGPDEQPGPEAAPSDVDATDVGKVSPPTGANAATDGLFASAAGRATKTLQTPHSCTGSGSDARRGDRAHRVPVEAELPGT